ncbi:MAG TPA: substrate-binding domain-containing protein [Symbiobacteriaceae bacterium]|nr:substrate-binding domain-containing protein [Symbiobacteriaceae bacterium]
MKPSPGFVLRVCFLLLVAAVVYGLVTNIPDIWRPLVTDTALVRTPDQPLRFVIVAPQASHPFWEAVRKGAQQAGDQLRINVEFTGSRLASIEEQVRLLDMATAAQVDGIITQGLPDQRFLEAVARATDRGIHVIMVDVDLPDHRPDRRVAFVGTDNEAAARLMADELVRRTGGKAVVGIVRGNLGPEEEDPRVQGFRKALESHPDVKIVAVETSDMNRSVAGQKALKILLEHPDVTVIYGTTALDAVGAAQSVSLLGRAVMVLGWDDVAEAGDHAARGAITAVVHQDPEQMGSLAVTLLGDYLRRDIRPPNFTPTPYYIRAGGDSK